MRVEKAGRTNAILKWSRRVRWSLMLAVLAYLGVCAYMWATQRQRVFEPTQTLQTTPGRMGMKFEELRIPSGSMQEHGELYAWWLPADVTDAEKLKSVQEKLEAGHAGALKIWQSMGYFMGYGVAHYADFYEIKHVLILGRCTSGRGGQIILDGANEVLKTEFPELAARIHMQLPDEKSRRVGQSIAAASLPQITH